MIVFCEWEAETFDGVHHDRFTSVSYDRLPHEELHFFRLRYLGELVVEVERRHRGDRIAYRARHEINERGDESSVYFVSLRRRAPDGTVHERVAWVFPGPQLFETLGFPRGAMARGLLYPPTWREYEVPV